MYAAIKKKAMITKYSMGDGTSMSWIDLNVIAAIDRLPQVRPARKASTNFKVQSQASLIALTRRTSASRRRYAGNTGLDVGQNQQRSMNAQY
jgi:hypothetical protein